MKRSISWRDPKLITNDMKKAISNQKHTLNHPCLGEAQELLPSSSYAHSGLKIVLCLSVGLRLNADISRPFRAWFHHMLIISGCCRRSSVDSLFQSSLNGGPSSVISCFSKSSATTFLSGESLRISGPSSS